MYRYLQNVTFLTIYFCGIGHRTKANFLVADRNQVTTQNHNVTTSL